MGGWVEVRDRREGGGEGGKGGGKVGKQRQQSALGTGRSPQSMGQREAGPEEGQVLESAQREKEELGG